jgi:trehalose utilization protein
MIKVTVWNEYRHERKSEEIAKVYPKGIHGAIADALSEDEEFIIRTATLDEPEHGLKDAVLNDTDVLIWWGHMAHADVSDEIVEKVAARVRGGMGMIVLHSGHFSKIFKKLTGTSGSLKWRDGDTCRVWVVNPAHPIAQGIGERIDLPEEEMYGEPFGIPEPDELVFISWFGGGEVMRSGCCFKVERGRMFYFQPGHESNPTYHNEKIRQVLRNACKWAAPAGEIVDTSGCEWRKVPTGGVK